ncbi:glycosyl hydrolase 2 galactose-binding domain-containing protein [Paenibacillus sp. TAB 01]|uniref:beta-mannosidase n=1 Tax=Paenibacillus sp. TAB 01 TaxID=3368988 RepID=UPI0037524A92
MKLITEFNEGWELKQAASSEPSGRFADEPEEGQGWIKTQIPAQVHEILLREGLIEDPALYGKGKECLWVAESDWLYRRSFAAPEQAGRTYLHFKGLDTLVDIYLNGRHLAYHNDMYLPLRVEITELLKEDNLLLLHFHSPYTYIEQADFPEAWEGKIRKSRLIRKNDQDFTDYLGAKPYLTRIGIYDKVVLEVVDDMEISETDVTVRLTEDYRQGRVSVRVYGSGATDDASVQIRVTGPDLQTAAQYSGPVQAASGGGDASGLRSRIHTAEVTIDHPQLWWPRGYGAQPLYELEVTLIAGGEVKDKVTKRIGFRDVKMPEPFDFRINGKQIKLWGAQSVQIQGMTHCWDDDKSNRLLDLLENANMNAQRIWGGANRYDDSFYEEADRRGVLIWQEFFHDYGMYPDTKEYRALCKQEAEYQVKRLKHHPSLLFWCGGNECFMGAEFELPGVPYIGGGIFLEDYKDVCETLDPDRYYHINSPYGGAYCNDPLEGDTHSYTNTWYVPGADYPVMIAEEIRTSPPSLRSFLRYMGEERAWPEGYTGMITSRSPYPWPDTWTEQTSAMGWKKIPPIELFYDADNLEAAVYKFGAAHAHYLRRILENNRRGKPSGDPDGERICKGHFVCRWNDTWPVIYGSMIDYYFEPFMPYYAVKRAYEPVLLSFDVQNFIYMWIVNDSPADVEGTLHVKLFHPPSNTFVQELQLQVHAASGESRLITDLNAFKQFSRECILYTVLIDHEGNTIARTNDFVDIEKKLRFPEAKLSMEVEGDTVKLTTDTFARSIELSGDGEGDAFGWLFEDNYFDLLPGEVKRVKIKGRHKQGTIRAKAYYSPYMTEGAFQR